MLLKNQLEIPHAEVYFLTEAEGNTQEGFTGMRPSFNINGDLILCFVYPLDGRERMPRGGTYQVRIVLGYGKLLDLSNFLKIDAPFTLQNADRVIAKGTILKI